MSVSPIKRKSKIISIRVSPEEYELLRRHECGSRSISQLARDALSRTYDIDGDGTSFAEMYEKLRTIDSGLRHLRLELSKVIKNVTAHDESSKAAAVETK
jgi:hypothetical protein